LEQDNARKLAGPRLSLRILRTIEELGELKPRWDEWCEDPDADFETFLVSSQCRPDFVRPHVMVVYADGAPECMLVGRLENTMLPVKAGYATVFRLRARRLFFVQRGLLGKESREISEFLIRAIISCLRQGEADMAELQLLHEKSSLHAVIQRQPWVYRGRFLPLHEHRVAKLPGSFDTFLKSLSRKERHETAPA
jgi:hypothetical protein